MIAGVEVTVWRPVARETDPFGNEDPVEWEPETVENVLVSPGATKELDAARPEGAEVALTLHFPKGYVEILRGCRVELTGPWAGEYRVIGDPLPYIDADTPTAWHLPVEVEAAHG